MTKYKSSWIRLGLAAIAAVLQACAVESPPVPPVPATSQAASASPNVLVILVDTLRPDHLGCYGYSRDTSPNIDRLAREGVLFERAYSSSTFTGEAVAAVFSGVWPMENPHGSGWYARPDPDRVVWPELFRQAGYATGHLANSPLMNNPGFNTGFDQFSCLVQSFGISGAGPQLTKKALEFVDEHAAKPYCLYLHYMDPHAPYDPPEEYYRRFSEQPMDDPSFAVDDPGGNMLALREAGYGPGDPRLDNQIVRYDAEIAFTDDSIGELLEGMKERGQLDNTIVVLLADHGEEFLEHGFMDHAWSVYEETLRVPLIVSWPGKLEPARIKENASTVALLPTLMKMIDANPARSDFSLPSLFAEEGGAWRYQSSGEPLFAELLIETRCMLRAVIDGDHKYIAGARWLDEACTQALFRVQKPLRNSLLAEKWKPLHPRAPSKREALFNLSTDPDESNDLIASELETAARLRKVLSDALAKAPAPKGPFEFQDVDPLPGLLQSLQANPSHFDMESQMDPETQQNLDALGYLGGSAQGDVEIPCVMP